MVSRVWMLASSMLAIGLMVSAMWAWQQAPHLSFDANRPDIALWAVRTAAIAGAALAQAVVLVMVVGNLYRTRTLDVVLRVVTASVFVIALVSAVALTLAGR